MPIMMATTDPPPNLVILGLVVGCVPWFGSTYAEGLKDLNGQTQADLPAALESRRYEALRRLSDRAQRIGATAVYGVRFDVRDINSTWRELCAYGTAVTAAG